MSNPLTISEIANRIGCTESDLGKLCETNPDLERIVLDAVSKELNTMQTEMEEVARILTQ